MAKFVPKWSNWDDVPWSLTSKQWEIEDYMNNGGKLVGLFPARRWGKTWYAVSRTSRLCVTNPNFRALFIGFTHGHAENVFYPLFQRLLHPSWVSSVASKLPVRINFRNGSLIDLVGSTEILQSQGVSYDLVIIDEVGDQDPAVWNQYLQPLLLEHSGTAMLLGTPKGTHSWVYNEIVINPDSDFKIFEGPTIDGGIISPANIEQARRNMPERQYRQEILGEWVSSTGLAYSEFDAATCVSDQVFNPELSTYVSWDFNVTPMCFCIIQPSLINPDGFVVVEEFSIENTTTRLCAEFLKDWLISHGFKRSVTPLQFTGDFAGNHRHTSAEETDWQILTSHFNDYVDFSARRRKTDFVRTRVTHCNQMFFDGRFKVSKKCPFLIREFSSMEYKKNGKELEDKHGKVGHRTDSACYFPWNILPFEDVIGKWNF